MTLVAEQETFLKEHLLAWGNDCLRKIEGNTTTELYRCMAELAQSFLALEREELQPSRKGDIAK
jgi:TorA maturation chaperone TorD